MRDIFIHKLFAPIKKYFPRWVSNFIRSVGTAIIGPILFSQRTGYFKSAFRMKAVSKNGAPIPWYTYPSIEFLEFRDYKNKKVLEFGGGQSSLWWANKAEQVVTFEGDQAWYDEINNTMPANVDLQYISMESIETNICQVRDYLASQTIKKFDVIVIDGLYRRSMIAIALEYLSNDGILICDNAEGYGFYEELKESDLMRVDFYGNAPGVVFPHCTSIYFNSGSFVFNSQYPIVRLTK